MILQKIRERTLNYHDSFTSWANPILTKKIKLEDFKENLKVFYGFYKPLEDRIYNNQKLQNLGLEIEKRKKNTIIIKRYV
ncbi:MAG: hypothetical protein KatS3mg068_2017 [Candidatus Sericytochromatia bacterium]|nr:MAG: hypothetical protein KatS3mg068_2017 [Candidatus Sericytochromatia bacterium]